MKKRTAETIERIDELLGGSELDDETVEQLVELLRPGESAPWPELEATLHLAEHEAIASELRMHALPDRLERAIGEALEAVLPMLGIRPYGPTFKIAQIARRELRAESEKFERVAAKLEEVGPERGREIVGRYLETEPAPMFVQRLRKLHPDLLERGSDWEPEGLEELVEDLDSLSEMLRSPSRLRALDSSELQGAARGVGDRATAVARALGSENWRHQLVGGALACWSELEDLAAACFRCVTEGSEVAPQLAVFAALLAPEQTRHAASTFLAEVSWQNPELPEAELTESRVRAILSARSILPRVDSPMENVDSESLPSIVERDDLREIPALVDDYWEAWLAFLSDSDGT